MGSAVSVISKMRSGLSIKGRPAGGGGRRGRPPRSARGPPDFSARPGASPTDSGAAAGTPRGARSRASPGAPNRCRGETGLVIAKVEPPPLPTCVVGRHGAGDVVVLVLTPQASDMPPAHTARRVLSSDVGCVNSSARKR
jgi:hypothetical protein